MNDSVYQPVYAINLHLVPKIKVKPKQFDWWIGSYLTAMSTGGNVPSNRKDNLL